MTGNITSETGLGSGTVSDYTRNGGTKKEKFLQSSYLVYHTSESSDRSESYFVHNK